MNTTTAMREQAVAEHWIDVEGTLTRYLEAGHGDPVLLVHGEGSVSEEWYGILKGLAGSHRTIAVDLPGYGHSEPTSDASPVALAAFAWKFAQAVGAERPAIIGHSLGGAVAAYMALQRPDHVPSLVLISSASMGRAINPVMLVLAVTPLGDLTKWLIPRLSFGPRLLVASVAVIGALRPWRLPARWWTSQIAAVSSPEALPTTLRSLRSSTGLLGQKNLLTGRLRELPMPTLVAWGVQDTLVPFWQAIAAQRRLPEGRLKLVLCTGHLVPMEAPNTLLKTIRPFLAHSGDAMEGGRRR
ncbi:alpha/beta fold hydrolase [Streptomyces zagrosensis]|uniref:Pimeloyl-ACP methyl ester carboxylesterase n=1 Tax=Streptomyces zagrosensis TaxID=1042984 RepID=A0A7W9UZ02_9ACTN|nr:alpha/beta fold hydrolase [Streptomyces zagrosensis]MBB5936242.1 pimeloyl-ACP methyl ester carboxylesterase [Streptomyces zagrosensis]